jgi:hypothetical protein
MNKPAFMLAERPPEPATEDQLAAIRKKAREARDAKLEKEAAELRVKELNQKIQMLEQTELPDMMEAAHLFSLGLEAEGNLPAYNLEIGPYYYANIKNEDANADKAYEYLIKNGHGAMIKRTYEISFGRGEDKKAAAFEKLMTSKKYAFTVKVGVPWNTLTAWLKEQVEKFKNVPPLDLMNGKVGRVAKLKPVKSK